MTDTQTVYLCDDNEGARESLAFHLRQHAFQVRVCASGPELLAAVDAAPRPLRGIFVLDERMEPLTGSQVHAQLLARGLEHRSPVIFLSGHGTVPVAVTAMTKGAITFIVKPFTDTIVDKIREALAKESLWFRRAERSRQVKALWSRIPPQQRRVAVLLETGTLNKVISDKMGIAERTVEEHRRKLFVNLRVKSTPRLATLMAEMRTSGVELDNGDTPDAPGGPPPEP